MWQIKRIETPSSSPSLRWGAYQAVPGTKVKRAIILVNGRTEWLEKYAFFIKEWDLSPEILWLSFDHRGQGNSGGIRAHIESYEEYSRDLCRLIEEACEGLPYILLSHSMGALVSLYGCLTGDLRPEALIMSSPLLGLPEDPLPKPILAPLAKALHSLGLGHIYTGKGGYGIEDYDTNPLSSDREGYLRMVQSPYPLPSPTVAWVRATLEAISRVHDPELIKKLQIPTFVAAAKGESVVDPDASFVWAHLAQSLLGPKIHMKHFEGKHELWNEKKALRLNFIAQVKSFLHKSGLNYS